MADSVLVKLLRPRVIGEAIALPLLSLAAYLAWATRTDGHDYCDSPVPPILGLLLFLGPVAEIVRVADPRHVSGRAALLGAAAGIAAAVLVYGAAYFFMDARSCFE